MKRTLLTFMLGLVLVTPTFAEESSVEHYPYVLKISTFSFITGKDFHYYLSPDKLIVFGAMKYGDNRKELFSYNLTNNEKERIHKFLSSFPLEKLKDQYLPEVPCQDGYAFEFSFNLQHNNPRIITLANTCQRDLNALVLQINSVLSEKFKLFTNWRCN